MSKQTFCVCGHWPGFANIPCMSCQGRKTEGPVGTWRKLKPDEVRHKGSKGKPLLWQPDF